MLRPRLLRYPSDDFFEHRPQKFLVKMIFISHCEIQILGKSIGFEVTLLETGAAFEYPTL